MKIHNLWFVINDFEIEPINIENKFQKNKIENIKNIIDSFKKMQDHAKKMNYQFPYVLDKKSELANKFGAKTTPHIFLFSNENKLVYKGSIDDNHKDIKSVKKFYLKDAIKQLIAKETVELNETKAVGCSIKRYKL